MVADELSPTTQSTAYHAQVHFGEPRGHCEGCVPGLWKDHGGRQLGRDIGHCRKAKMDHQAWREKLEGGEERYQLPHDVQVE